MDEWNDIVLTGLDVESVPGGRLIVECNPVVSPLASDADLGLGLVGMGQFDIDGLEPEDSANLVSGGLAALAYLTFSTLVVGGVIGYFYFSQLQQQKEMMDMLDMVIVTFLIESLRL